MRGSVNPYLQMGSVKYTGFFKDLQSLIGKLETDEAKNSLSSV